ncbi:UNVERIFIED_CONTAM: hypothetical protein Sindi_0044800 [Sesamum indicum]
MGEKMHAKFPDHPIPEDQKVSLAAIHMEGRAELWYQGHVEKRGMPSWTELALAMLERFEDLNYERVVSEFNMLRQEITVNAYLERFEELGAYMLKFNKNWNEDFFMMKFISGLKNEIKGYVATMKPTTLNQAIVHARKQETMVNVNIKESNQQQKSNPNKIPYKPSNRNQSYKPAFKHSFKARDENPHPEDASLKQKLRLGRRGTSFINVMNLTPLGIGVKLVHSLSKLLRMGVMKSQVHTIEKEIQLERSDPELLELLHQFRDLFKEPNTLLPERKIYHKIELLPDSIPKKQHPYRYAYGQKTGIENIVKEMLKSGIIKSSQSSFASPMLLVKKKDGG